MTTFETTTTRLVQQELGACALIQDLLPLYFEGEVNPTSRDLIVEHLARCERCAGFLAGAQTTRVQLRRDAMQRVDAMQRNEPAQRTLSNGQRFAQLIAAFTICVVGGVSAALTVETLQNPLIIPLIGFFVSFGCLFALGAVAYPTVGLRMLRWCMLAVCCGTGTMATIVFTYFMHNGNSLATSMMFSLGITSFIGIALAMQWRIPSRL